MKLPPLRTLLRQGWLAARDWTHAGHTYATAHWRQFRGARFGPVGAAGSPCSRIPVVFLPGILEPWTYLAPLARHLSSLGHPVHFVETLGWNIASLEASADRCLRALAEDDVQGAVLVAHSKGGLIGKAVLLSDHLDGAAIGLIAIATPFGGSTVGGPLQRLGLVTRSPLGLFTPGGPELSALAREQAVNSRIVSMAPSWDQIIPNGSHLEGAVNVTLDVPGHFRPVHDPAVWDLVHDHIHALAE